MMSHPADRINLLHKVTRVGFVPALPESPVVRENRLRGEIDDFAATFFATPREPRREQWQALADRCTFSPPLTARLLTLEPGLDVDIPFGSIGNPRTAQLASHVAGLFVLAPAARAVQRQAVLRSMVPDITAWKEIVKQLQTVAPELAALEPTLLRSILSWRERQQQLDRVRQVRQPSAPRPPSRPARRPRTPASTGSGSGSNAGKGVGCGAMFLVAIVIRFCVGAFGSHSSTTYYNPPPPVHFDPPPQVAPFQDPNRGDDWQRIRREAEEEQRRRDEQERRRRFDNPPRRQPIDPGADRRPGFPPDD